MTYATIALALLSLLSLLALQRWLSRRRTPWAGAVLPVLAAAAAVWALSTGRLPTLRDHLAVGLALVVLLSIWARGREQAAGPVCPAPDEAQQVDPVS